MDSSVLRTDHLALVKPEFLKSLPQCILQTLLSIPFESVLKRLGLLYLNKRTFFKCCISLAAELESSRIVRKIFGFASRSRIINQSHCSIPGIVISWFFSFCFSVYRYRFRRAYCSTYDSDFRFSLGRKPSYSSDCDPTP